MWYVLSAAGTTVTSSRVVRLLHLRVHRSEQPFFFLLPLVLPSFFFLVHLSPFLLSSSFSSLNAASSSFLLSPPKLLKCVTFNWKENSVKVQSVVREREKRKAKEAAAFLSFQRIPPNRDRRERTPLRPIIFIFALEDNWSARRSQLYTIPQPPPRRRALARASSRVCLTRTLL